MGLDEWGTSISKQPRGFGELSPDWVSESFSGAHVLGSREAGSGLPMGFVMAIAADDSCAIFNQ